MRQHRLGAFFAAVAVGLGGALAAPLSPAAASVRDSCMKSIPGLGAATAAQIPAKSTQAVVTTGNSRTSSYNTIGFWTRSGGCWSAVRFLKGRNGYAGWHPRPWDGSGFSPIGVFTLTDAGGRLANPGTSLQYFYRPQWYAKGGFKMNNKRIQVFNYLVAINFNRYPGKSPLNLVRPDRSLNDGGIWFHVSGAGATRGCVSLPQHQMKWALQWLTPGATPVMVMGPAKTLAG